MRIRIQLKTKNYIKRENIFQKPILLDMNIRKNNNFFFKKK